MNIRRRVQLWVGSSVVKLGPADRCGSTKSVWYFAATTTTLCTGYQICRYVSSLSHPNDKHNYQEVDLLQPFSIGIVLRFSGNNLPSTEISVQRSRACRPVDFGMTDTVKTMKGIAVVSMNKDTQLVFLHKAPPPSINSSIQVVFFSLSMWLPFMIPLATTCMSVPYDYNMTVNDNSENDHFCNELYRNGFELKFVHEQNLKRIFSSMEVSFWYAFFWIYTFCANNCVHVCVSVWLQLCIFMVEGSVCGGGLPAEERPWDRGAKGVEGGELRSESRTTEKGGG